MPKTMRPWVAAGVMSCQPSWCAVRPLGHHRGGHATSGGAGQAEAEAERQRRAEAEAERQRTGKPRRGRAPKEVDETPADNAQMSFTVPELTIMPTNNKGWDYCGNAQASVDGAYQIIVACDVTAEANDKQHAAPMAQLTVAHLEQAGIAVPKDAAVAAQKIPATYDSGYYSEAAAEAVEQLGFDPYMATGRPRHQAPAAEVREPPTTAKDCMARKCAPPRPSPVRLAQNDRGTGVWSD